MYVRDAKNREEVWLLDRLDEFGFEDPAFRSRDYVLALDERHGERAGFGRLRVHRTEDGEVCELTNLGVLEAFRGQGVGARLLQRLIENARDAEFETVYANSPAPAYLEQFGFEPADPETLPDPLQKRVDTEGDDPNTPMVVDVTDFSVPRRLRRRFEDESTETEHEERAEDFGIDPEAATYKYDVDGD
jgi:N-acetylglutamate synthase-like GNAT family acetyltransferase